MRQGQTGQGVITDNLKTVNDAARLQAPRYRAKRGFSFHINIRNDNGFAPEGEARFLAFVVAVNAYVSGRHPKRRFGADAESAVCNRHSVNCDARAVKCRSGIVQLVVQKNSVMRRNDPCAVKMVVNRQHAGKRL
ncbi:hypothetical protein D3C71_1707000 [compost metagenome]